MSQRIEFYDHSDQGIWFNKSKKEKEGMAGGPMT
jgi:hypothetical protein